MIIYIILPVAALASAIMILRLRYGKELYCLLWGVALFAVAAIRREVGYDYILYHNWYDSLEMTTIDNITLFRQEKGFLIPLKLMRDLGVDPQMMFVGIALIVAVLVMIFIYHYSENVAVSLFSFFIFGFFANSMCFMRQIIAALIVCYSLKYIFDKRFFRFLALVLLGSIFHVSALIMIPFYWIFRIKMNGYTVAVFSVFTIVAGIFSEQILGFITSFVYTGYDLFDSYEMANGVSPVYTIAFAAVFLLAFLLRKILVRRNPDNNYLITALFFGVALSYFGIYHAVVGRLALYFVLPAILLLSAEIFDVVKGLILLTFKNDARLKYVIASVAAVLALCLCGAHYTFSLYDNSNGVVPYKTVFDSGTNSEDGK